MHRKIVTRTVMLTLFLMGALCFTSAKAQELLTEQIDADIWTNQADYAPFEVVIIYGSGFDTSSVISVRIDGPEIWGYDEFDNVNFPQWVEWQYDEYGNFALLYLKEKCYGSFYVTITDGTHTATTMFTDGNASHISGTVLDGSDNPISGATVACTSGSNGSFSTTTDTYGYYEFSASNVGKITFAGTSATLELTASKTGYTSNSITFAVNNGGTYTGKDIVLSLAEIDIEVTADSGQTKVYGDDDPTFTYTITSGALASGDSFTGELSRDSGEDVGTYAIQIGTLDIDNSVSGTTYNLTFVSADFTITPLEITVTPDSDQSKVYGENDPVLTYTYDPELIGTDAFDGVLSRDTGEDVGFYDITQGTLSLSSNYTLTFTSGVEFEITPLEITVTPDSDQSKVYGTDDPTLTYTYDPELIGDDEFSGELDRETGENVGLYYITQGTLSLSSNYTLTFVDDVQFEITQAHTSIVLTVSPQIIVSGATFNLSATLSSSDSPTLDLSGLTITFSLDYNPLTGVAGYYVIGTALTNSSGVAVLNNVSTTGWLGAVYVVTATYEGDTNIVGCFDDASLVVADPGAAATGGGFISDNGRTNFGFTVRMVEGTTNTYKGQFVIINNGKWRMKGTLDSYGTLSGTGYAGGYGKLYQWVYDSGLDVWYWFEVAANVPVILTFTDTYNGSGTGSGKKTTIVLDTFGLQINYSSQDFNASNPNTIPLSLKGGNIDIKSANNTTDGNPSTPPKGKR